MLWIFSGEPGGPQKAHLEATAQQTPGSLWISYDQHPPEGAFWATWFHPPFTGLAAAASRWASPRAETGELLIPTLDGFSGKAQRPPVLSDHSPETLALAQAITGRKPLPSAVFLAGLSSLYDTSLATIASTTPHHWVEKAVELVPAYASAALSHLLFDLKRTGVPVIATCWEVPQGKRFVPHLPRSVTHLADDVITDYGPSLGTRYQEELTRAIRLRRKG